MKLVSENREAKHNYFLENFIEAGLELVGCEVKSARAGKVNLKDSLALLKEVDLMLGNDSGNLHMAASVGTKVIGLYGPMPFEKWKALGDGHKLLKADLECMPCSLRGTCNNNKACMKAITVEQVKQAIDEVLKH